MSEFVPDELLPPNTQFEWGVIDGEKVIHEIHVDDGHGGGIFHVNHHILPPILETPILLRASGLREEDTAKALHVDRSTINDWDARAYEMLGVRQRKLNAPLRHAAIGRLCLPGSVLEVAKPITFGIEPDDLSLRALQLLGQGYGWGEVAEECSYGRTGIHYRIKKWYHLQDGRLKSSPLLLHLYGSRHLDPPAVLAQPPRTPTTQSRRPVLKKQEVLPEETLPLYTQFEWGMQDGDLVVEKLYVGNGELKVRHGILRPRPETTLILRAAGVASRTVAKHILGTDKRGGILGKYTNLAVDGLATPDLRNPEQLHAAGRRLYASIARLFQAKVFEIVKPLSFCGEPPERDIELIKHLGLGGSWKGIDWRRRHAFWRRVPKWHEHYPGQFSEPLLLHSYWGGLVDPAAIVAEQDAHRSARMVAANSFTVQCPAAPEAPEPFTFCPFPDSKDEEAAYIRMVPGATLNTSKILDVRLSYDTAFDVVGATDLLASGSKLANATEREKLGIILLALGASFEEVSAYCLEFKELIKFNVRGQWQAARIACRDLLIPRTVPSLDLPQEFIDTAQAMQSGALQSSGNRTDWCTVSQLKKTYELRSPSLIMLLAHAAGQLLQDSQPT